MTEITRNDGKDDGGSGKSDEDRNSDQENFFMRQALNVAKDALEIGEVPVGCVIVLRDATLITSTSIPKEHIRGSCTSYDMSPSVIISHGSNQVNATRDATRHAEIVAIDRMLARGRSSDQLKLPPDVIPPDVICKSAEDGEPTADSNGRVKYEDSWINIPECSDHWKNSFGWGSGRVYDKDILSQCDLYVTCEPCIMVRKNLRVCVVSNIIRINYDCHHFSVQQRYQ
jgi:tRNA(Arg) A34 adenosine deaminase TadA